MTFVSQKNCKPHRSKSEIFSVFTLASIAVLILAATLLLDIEHSLFVIRGEGERLSHSADLVYSPSLSEDALVLSSTKNLDIKLSDMILFILALLLLPLILFLPFTRIIQDFRLSEMLLFYLFCILGFLSLMTSPWPLTHRQQLICSFYLMKFIEMSFVFLFTVYCLHKRKLIMPLIMVLAYSSLLASIIGIINVFFPLFSGWIIQDRPSFYGPLVVLSPLWLDVFIKRRFRETGLNPLLVAGVIILSFLAVALCGKRTVLLGYISAVCWVLYRNKNTIIKKINTKKLIIYSVIFIIVCT